MVFRMVFRELELVVAITSSTTANDERHGYRRQLFDVLDTCPAGTRRRAEG